MIRFSPTGTGGRRLVGETPFGSFEVEWDVVGNLVTQSITMLQPISPDYDPTDKSNFQSCCDPPSE